MNTNTKRLFKGILSQAMVDALYVFDDDDNKEEVKYLKKLAKWKIQYIEREKIHEEKLKEYLIYKEKKEIKHEGKLKKYEESKKKNVRYKRKKPNMEFVKREPKKDYLAQRPVRKQTEVEFKRDALNWLYGRDKKDLWILELCCDVCNVTQEQVIRVIEKHHKEKPIKENFFET
tara:strand:+ start:59 stop:580 length:522 start_codon:yes stop_codon:yes gene_type:complete